MLPGRPGDAAAGRHDRVVARARCRAGTRSRSPATTSARRARPPRRSSRSRSRTASPTSSRRSTRGLDVDDFAPRLSFFFNAHIDFFEEIAKYRAARRIWARELRDTYGARNPRSWLMRTHVQTAGVSLTAQQPLNNITRTAIEALAGVLGGTQSLHTNSYDEALALPTEEAVRIALRTQQIIAHETGVANTIDPLGGSYFVEALTDELEAPGLRRTSRRSTSSAAWSRRSSRASRSARSPTPASSCSRDRLAAGASSSASTPTPTATTASCRAARSTRALERKQIDRVQAVRARRDGAARRARARARCARRRRATARTSCRTFSTCARVHATEGEIVDALQEVLGDYRETPVF